MRRIPIIHAAENDIVAHAIYDEFGRPLLNTGQVLKKNHIDRIRQLGIQSVYVANANADIEALKTMISPLLRVQSTQCIKKLYMDFLKADLMNTGKNKIFKENEAVKSLYLLAQKLIDELFINRDVLIEMVDIKKLDHYHFEHCINTAVIALILGFEFNLRKDELIRMCMAIFLMDVGYVYLKRELLYENRDLTHKERLSLQDHVNISRNIVKDNTLLDPRIATLILQHHEHFDGTGYPNGISGYQIDLLSQIISIADCYDALTSDRPYRAAYSPDEALNIIMTESGKKFSFELVNIFVKKVVAYPKGTYIKLSNNQQGYVKAYNRDIPQRPIIELADKDSLEGNGIIVDLSKHLNLTITKVIYHFDD